MKDKIIEWSRYVIQGLNQIDRATFDSKNTQAVALWIAAILTGTVAVIYARIFKSVEEFSVSLLAERPEYLFIASPLLMLVAWWMVARLAPEAAGSGIPQVMSAIDTDYSGSKIQFVDRLLSLKIIPVKIIGSLLCVAGGGAIGREGPTLQVSASIFHVLRRVTRRFFPESNEQTWVIAGAAAGLASAFNTPLGGIVYAIEELGMHHFHRVRTALLSAVIVSGLVAQGMFGSYLYLGFPKIEPVTSQQWPVVVLVGVLSGLAGGFFTRLLLFLSRKRRALGSQKKLALFSVFCGLVISTLVYFQPYSHGSGSELISDILFKGQVASFGLTISRFFATMVAYLVGTAGGVFSPSLTIGACIGSKIAFLSNSGNINLFAMLGMIGFLTGVTHTPFTSFILVMEMSDRHSAIFPMMLTALIANSLAKVVQKKSFYESIRDELLVHQTAEGNGSTSTG